MRCVMLKEATWNSIVIFKERNVGSIPRNKASGEQVDS